MIQVFGTKKCMATRAAQRSFSDRRVKVQQVDLGEKGLSKGELASVAKAVGGWLKLYDPKKDPTPRHVAPTDSQLEKLLLDHPEWLVTPIVRDGAKAFVGADEAGWKSLLP